MRFYLSSFKLGNESHRLADLYGDERPIGYFANALDHIADRAWLDQWIDSDVQGLIEAGLVVQKMDLRDFFPGAAKFEQAATGMSGVWLSGGNVFVLRQAMRLSGFDDFVCSPDASDQFVYGGYSAACCVLSPSLKAYSIVDDPNVRPYPEISDVVWDGLGVLDFAFMPHFRSTHSESALVEKEIEYCVENDIPYRAFRDGEVLVL